MTILHNTIHGNYITLNKLENWTYPGAALALIIELKYTMLLYYMNEVLNGITY